MKATWLRTVSISAVVFGASTGLGFAQSMDEMVAAAKAEGMLTTIALPHSWCGYGDVIAGFKAKYPEITVNELNPDAGSADEIEAVKANIGNTGPQAPDVLDVGFSYGPGMKADGIAQPYKVSTWDSIPRTRRIRTASGTATTTACSPSRSTRRSFRTARRIGRTC
jgi:putative spermidine/putrescine transport system substrate-binding protein